MFCANCGKEIQESAIFCSFCGTKKGSVAQPSEQIKEAAPKPDPIPEPQPSTTQPVHVPESKPKTIRVLQILSIIGFFLYPFSFYAFNQASYIQHVINNASMTFCFALAHAIVGLVQGTKRKIKPLKIMGIIGIIWSCLSYFFIVTFAEQDYDAYLGWTLLGLGYALAFAIVSMMKAKIKEK